MAESDGVTRIVLPEGRLINHSLFAKDQFNERAAPSYKVELAYEPDVLNDLHNACLDFAIEKWGEGADGDDLVVPILTGDVLAERREKKGKPGDAYSGKEVIRAKTIYNRDGEDGPGGVQVFGPDRAEMTVLEKQDVYQGSYGIVAVTLSGYTDSDTNNNAITLYLVAYQKTRDGERLVSPADHSNLFKPVGREGKKETTRAKRKG